MERIESAKMELDMVPTQLSVIFQRSATAMSGLAQGKSVRITVKQTTLKVWADAATKAKSTDAAAVAAALRSGTFESAVGPLTYDNKGDIKNPVYDIYVWKGGKSYPGTK